MSLVQRLQQRQSQNLVMTPQLAQSIKLLQYSHTELFDFVRDEIEKNPLLELGDGSSDGVESRDAGGDTNQAKTETDIKSSDDGSLENVASIVNSGEMSAGDQLDASFENVFDDGATRGEKAASDASVPGQIGQAGSRSGGSQDSDFDLLANMGETVDLVEFLERQVSLEFKNPQERSIATYIAHEIDQDGYFKEPVSEAAAQNNVDEEEFERILKKFQTLEPSGIGARNLAECLAIQLAELNRYDPAMQALVANLDKLAKREFAELMQICEVGREDFVEMIDEIKALDPRPARNFEPVLAETVVPDVLITQSNYGDWNIDLNPQTLPKVLIDREYHMQITSALRDTDGEKFVDECMEKANWLVRTLDQRAQTILKVTAEIVKKQDRFFAEGKQYLKPLTLKTVADAIKMHESTVSRVTSNKYLNCAHGTFELKFFFSSAISATDGDEMVSAEAVKYQIKRMIDAEPATKILSDEQIVNNLQEAGIEIARRTVAKYREAMKISSSVQRRREKSVLL